MKKAGILLAVAVFCLNITPLYSQTHNGRHLLFGYTTIIENLPAGASEVKVWVPYPLEAPYQQVIELEKSEAILTWSQAKKNTEIKSSSI